MLIRDKGLLCWIRDIETPEDESLFLAMQATNTLIKGGERLRQRWLKHFCKDIYDNNRKNMGIAWFVAWDKTVNQVPTPQEFKSLCNHLGYNPLGENILRQLCYTWDREKSKQQNKSLLPL